MWHLGQFLWLWPKELELRVDSQGLFLVILELASPRPEIKALSDSVLGKAESLL